MKKTMIIFMVLWALFQGASYAESFADLAVRLNTPEKIEAYMQKELSFRADADFTVFDAEEYWQSPEELIKNKRGDCEDFSEFAKEILIRNGFEAVLFEGVWESRAHAVTVFKDKAGKIFVFNFDNIKPVKAKNISGLLDSINSGRGHQWNWAAIMRREGSAGIMARRYDRKQAGETLVSDLFRK